MAIRDIWETAVRPFDEEELRRGYKVMEALRTGGESGAKIIEKVATWNYVHYYYDVGRVGTASLVFVPALDRPVIRRVNFGGIEGQNFGSLNSADPVPISIMRPSRGRGPSNSLVITSESLPNGSDEETEQASRRRFNLTVDLTTAATYGHQMAVVDRRPQE